VLIQGYVVNKCDNYNNIKITFHRSRTTGKGGY